MHLIISKPGGKPLEALVLAVGENRLRAVVAGSTDVVELHRNYGQWSSDLGEVQVEAMIVNDRIDINLFRAEFCPEERAAGFQQLPILAE